jgi:hypothetical protein
MNQFYIKSKYEEKQKIEWKGKAKRGRETDEEEEGNMPIRGRNIVSLHYKKFPVQVQASAYGNGWLWTPLSIATAAMPDLSTSCGQAIPETAVSGVARSQSWQPMAVFYHLGHPTPYVSVFKSISTMRLCHKGKS